MTATSIIRRLGEVGGNLGYEVDIEHWTQAARNTAIYRPRIDCLWAARLSRFGYDTSPLDKLLGAPLASPYGLIGFEVEATDPTTKRQFSNVANLAVAAVPYAVLMVNCATAPDALRRANRVIRAFNRRFGFREAVAVDTSLLQALANVAKHPPLARRANASVPEGLGRGGEGAATTAMRHRLVDLGLDAGFEVLCDASDPRLLTAYDTACRTARDTLDVAWSLSESRQARSFGQLYTDSQPDVVWAVRVGRGLRSAVDALAAGTPASRSTHQTFGPVPELLPVATFELESRLDKHGAGAILSLGSRPGIGLLVNLSRRADAGQRVLDAYRPIVGAGNVVAIDADVLSDL